jgi:hypothetical protein
VPSRNREVACYATGPGPSGFTRWAGSFQLAAGEHLVEVRVHDRAGDVQPVRPRWNAFGYANKSIHRIAVTGLHDQAGWPLAAITH